MTTKSSTPLRLPSSDKIRDHILESLGCCWSKNAHHINALPIRNHDPPFPVSGPLRLVDIVVPKWATTCAVHGKLLVPLEALQDEGGDASDTWKAVDWFLAAFLLLECWHERVWENEHGPIHSYSFRLKGWDERAWQHAWVNRIGLFLRLWAVQQLGTGGELQLGPLPKTKILMTHDVDAIAKTLPIRLKQGAFNLFNTARALRKARLRKAIGHLRQATQFLVGCEDWWTFDKLLNAERVAGVSAIYHFHADQRPKTLKRWLFDPGYNIAAPKQLDLLHQITEAGHQIGLHPSFENWQNAAAIADQRGQLQQAAGCSITHCRQHWLRFSWQDTWTAQAAAGLEQDATMMFNDRPGFRNSSALVWRPWRPESNSQHMLSARPTVLMDSHFYDYESLTPEYRRQQIRGWITECDFARGQAAVLWHPHTLTNDYGWKSGFDELLSCMKER